MQSTEGTLMTKVNGGNTHDQRHKKFIRYLLVSRHYATRTTISQRKVYDTLSSIKAIRTLENFFVQQIKPSVKQKVKVTQIFLSVN